MSSTGQIIPAWEQKIREKAVIPVASLDKMSMNSLDAIETAQFAAPMYKKYEPAPDNFKSQLISIHIITVQKTQTATKTCIDTIQGLKHTQTDKNVWDATIKNVRETAKQNFSKRFDNASDEAIETIKALPPVQQNRAANFFSYGMGIVSKVINQASYGLSDIVTKDLLAGNWNTLTEVDNTVKAGCGAAMDALKSMF
ncbi:hypothetical protein FACUT_13093 [Fusarium acutatum]|uniref:Uncharacterized protein n=1 Tax=Fusarium acutatum TaxID=78861 RepID=A0A8H4JCG7_9HYPO|nr:hypothetical protein FACUT_13093 [Fusarium acutatum]